MVGLDSVGILPITQITKVVDSKLRASPVAWVDKTDRKLGILGFGEV
jgi:hypothetical protein